VHIHPQFAEALKRADATWQEHEHHSGEQLFSVACSFAVFSFPFFCLHMLIFSRLA